MGNILCVISFSSPPLKHRETLRFHLKLFFTHRQTWLTTLQKALKVQTVGGPSVKSAMIALRYAATPQLSSNPCRARLKRVKSYVIGEREREILPNRLLLVSILSDRLSVTWQLQGNYQSSEGGLKLTMLLWPTVPQTQSDIKFHARSFVKRK